MDHVSFTRQFLSSTYAKDCHESVLLSYRNNPPLTQSFLVEFSGLDGFLANEDLVFSSQLFDFQKSAFYGSAPSFRVGDRALFHTPVEGVAFVVEARNLKNKPVAWAYIPLRNLEGNVRIPLERGTAQILLIPERFWPLATFESFVSQNQTTNTAKQPLSEVHIFAQRTLFNALPHLIPAGRFVSASFCNYERQPSFFRIEIDQIRVASASCFIGVDEIALAECPNLTEGEWDLLVFCHNTHLMLGGVESLVLRPSPGEGALFEAEDGVVFFSVPLHRDSCVVFCIRHNVQAVGFAVLPLVGTNEEVEDINLLIHDLPFLKGPFSCADPRTLNMEEDDAYGDLHCVIAHARCAYYDSSNPPERVETSQDNHISEIKSEYLPDQNEVGKNALESKELMKSLLYELQRADRSLHSGIHKEGSDKPTVDNSGVLLKSNNHSDIRDTLDSVLKTVSIPSSYVASETFYGLCLPADRRETLNMHRPALLSCTENIIAFTSGTLRARTCTQCVFRFDALTLSACCSYSFPPLLCIRFSFAILEEQNVGPFSVQELCPAGSYFGATLLFVPSQGTTTWTEPTTCASFVELCKRVADRPLYFLLYDAENLQYLATAHLNIADLATRSLECTAVEQRVDLPLYEDLGLSGLPVPPELPLVSSPNIGLLHLSVALIGVSAADSPRASISNMSFKDKENHTIPMLPIPQIQKLSTSVDLPARKIVRFIDHHPPSSALEGTIENVSRFTDEERKRYVATTAANSTAAFPFKAALSGLSTSLTGPNSSLECQLSISERFRACNEASIVKAALEAQSTTYAPSVVLFGLEPAVAICLVKNPSPMRRQFTLEISPVPISIELKIKLDVNQASTIDLAPHESCTVRVSIQVAEEDIVELCKSEGENLDNANGTKVCAKLLLSSDGIVVSRTVISVRLSTPFIDRRVTFFVPAGGTYSRRLLYSLSTISSRPADVPCIENNMRCIVVPYSRSEVLALPYVAHRSALKGLARGGVLQIQELLIDGGNAPSSPTSFYLYVCEKSGFETQYKCWKVTLDPCCLCETAAICFGGTSEIVVRVDIPVENYHWSTSNAELARVRRITSQNVVLIVRPTTCESKTEFLLVGSPLGNVGTDSLMKKFLISVPVVPSQPLLTDFVDVPLCLATEPIFRRISFTNKEEPTSETCSTNESKNCLFCVATTYADVTSVAPREFICPCGHTQEIAVAIHGLDRLGKIATFPIWVFINKRDRQGESQELAESFLITVRVLESAEITNIMQ